MIDMKFVIECRRIITIILALSGIALIFYYDYCASACIYLRGDIWEIDLKFFGIIYMLAILIFAAIKQTPLVRILLAAGLGVEVFLFSFQVQNDVYCPFCLAFALMVIVAFMINYEVPSAWHENRRRMWLYFLGEVNLPMSKIQKFPLLLVSVFGYLVILSTFSGSVTPAYGQDTISGIPFLGKGDHEVIVFADYFCPPCRRIDSKAEPLFKELLATGKVKITFVDVPFSRVTPVYAKYYLYAANANSGVNNILRVRKTLFDAAQGKRILTENALLSFLSEQKIIYKPYDERPVFQQLNRVIKQNKIDSTPTCVIHYSATDIRKFVGDDEMWDGLVKLKTHLGIGKNNSK